MAAAALAVFAAGCGDPPDAPIAGSFTRAAYHLVVLCPDEPARVVDLLYPANLPESTFLFGESGQGTVKLWWDGEELGRGWRTGPDSFRLEIERRDPFTGPIAWRFLGEVREDLRFHERTLAGRIVSGTYRTSSGQDCPISPRSVAWFTTRPRGLDAATRTFAPRASARARGNWNRFVWFLDVGPFPMRSPRVPWTRDLRLFSFASTGGGLVTAGDEVAFVDNGFPAGPWVGAGRGPSLVFPQHEYAWELDYAQDVVWEDDSGSSLPGIRRVLAGFVTGGFRVDEAHYPSGWSGETGMLPMTVPGMAFWLDVDRGTANAAAPQALRAAPAAGVLPRIDGAVVLDEGVPVADPYRISGGTKP